MKSWEILKAVDEGKIVQFYSVVEQKWIDCTSIHMWTSADMTGKDWRIKPEPRKFKIWYHTNSGTLHYNPSDDNEKTTPDWELIEVTENVS